MKIFFAEMKKLMKNPVFTIALAASLALGYWFCCTHTSIGIDTLTRPRYLSGELFAQGRFSAVILSNLFFTRFMPPPIVDLFAVFVLFFAGTALAAVLNVASNGRLSILQMTFFACFFSISPLFAEIFIYAGTGFNIAVGFLLIAISCMISLDAARCGKKLVKLLPRLAATLLIWAFLMSLYESLIFCGVLLVCEMLVLMTYFGEAKTGANVSLRFILFTAIPMVLGMAFEFVIGKIYALTTGNVSTEAATSIFPNGFTTLSGIRVTLYVMFRKFFLAGLGYLPIALFAIALIMSALMCILLCIKKKNAIYALWFIGQYFAVFILAILREGSMKYRTCQTIPLFTAFVFMMIFVFLAEKVGALPLAKSKTAPRIACILIMVCLTLSEGISLTSSFMMNNARWQEDRKVLLSVANAIQSSGFDTSSKPVVFYGEYTLSDKILSDKFMRSDSNAYKISCKIAKVLGGSLETYDYSAEYPIGLALSENMSAITWGVDAFKEVNTELLKIYRYLGFDYIQGTNSEYYGAKAIASGENNISPSISLDSANIFDLPGYIAVVFN